MNKKRMGAALVALLMCGLVSQSSAQDVECGLVSQSPAQDAEHKFNSNGDDITRIRGLLDEFRQDIIRKDGYALTKLVLNIVLMILPRRPAKAGFGSGRVRPARFRALRLCVRQDDIASRRSGTKGCAVPACSQIHNTEQRLRI